MVYYLLAETVEKRKNDLERLTEMIRVCSENVQFSSEMLKALQKDRRILDEKIRKTKLEMQCFENVLEDLVVEEEEIKELIENCYVLNVIKVDDERNEEINNGLIDLKRDVVMKLIKLINNTDNIRKIIGMAQIFYYWSKQHIFRWARDTGDENSFVIDVWALTKGPPEPPVYPSNWSPTHHSQNLPTFPPTPVRLFPPIPKHVLGSRTYDIPTVPPLPPHAPPHSTSPYPPGHPTTREDAFVIDVLGMAKGPPTPPGYHPSSWFGFAHGGEFPSFETPPSLFTNPFSTSQSTPSSLPLSPNVTTSPPPSVNPAFFHPSISPISLVDTTDSFLDLVNVSGGEHIVEEPFEINIEALKIMPLPP